MFISRVILQDYKSIAACDVKLGPLSFLVGPNGAGKSNFFDAMRFIADATRTSLKQAIDQRGGIGDIGRRSGDTPRPFGVRLEMHLQGHPDPSHYALLVAPLHRGGFQVQKEECLLRLPDGEKEFRVEQGKLIFSTLDFNLEPSIDSLHLIQTWPFGDLLHRLSRMAFYHLEPDQMRPLQKPEAGALLSSTGQNLASVMTRLSSPVRRRIEEYLQQVVPELASVEVKQLARQFETIEFRQHDQRFLAADMSDGTLRMLGILVALFQSNGRDDSGASLVGIEEPENAIHPGAAAVLRDALRETSEHTQVLVTTHSPDVLDNKDIDAESLLAVTFTNGSTTIAPLDGPGRASLRDHMYTAGELLRLNQLQPELRVQEGRVSLFDREPF